MILRAHSLGLSSLLLVASSTAIADVADIFRFDDGHTNWQYVANTTGSVLILALGYTIIRLVLSHRKANRYNRQLEEIRSQLEQRVKERTANLDESVKLLNEANRVLEGEISEHQATSERLRMSQSYISSILRSMPLMLIGLNQECKITQWNHRAEEISGLSAEDALGGDLWQAYPGITVTPQQVKEALEQNKTITIKQSQRDQFHFDVTLYPLEKGSETGVVILIDDVTQRVSAENMLVQRDKLAAMGELAAAMAYDLNTPLQGITNDINAIAAAIPSDSTQTNLVTDALARSEQASRVIDNLLEFSHAGEGDKTAAQITDILDHSLNLASQVLSAPDGLQFRNIQIDKQYATELPLVNCYEAELQQVFLSLFRHCCHALGKVTAEDFEPMLTLTVSTFYDALWVKVQHNGKGISLEQQQYIFEPFIADSGHDPSDEFEAGRRLSFPYFIIAEQHHGQMAVTSDPKSGTTFHIELII